MKLLRIALFVLAVTSLSFGQTLRQTETSAKSPMVPTGDWGGEHISMTVTADGADMEFDCAIGYISSPLVTKADGTFRLKGTYKRQSPAPMQADGNGGMDVVFSGKWKGDTLHLQMEFPGQSDSQTFDLVRGQEPRLNKCA